MKIEKYPIQRVLNIFPKLYMKIFKAHDVNEKDLPPWIYVGFNDGSHVGFMSAYYHNTETLYIQRVGIIKQLRGKGLSLQLWNETLNYLETEEPSLRYILGTIENTNIKPLLVALHSGFMINGTQMSTDGKLYVRIIKDLKNKEG